MIGATAVALILLYLFERITHASTIPISFKPGLVKPPRESIEFLPPMCYSADRILELSATKRKLTSSFIVRLFRCYIPTRWYGYHPAPVKHWEAPVRFTDSCESLALKTFALDYGPCPRCSRARIVSLNKPATVGRWWLIFCKFGYHYYGRYNWLEPPPKMTDVELPHKFTLDYGPCSCCGEPRIIRNS